jgi:hypothetical protein
MENKIYISFEFDELDFSFHAVERTKIHVKI